MVVYLSYSLQTVLTLKIYSEMEGSCEAIMLFAPAKAHFL